MNQGKLQLCILDMCIAHKCFIFHERTVVEQLVPPIGTLQFHKASRTKIPTSHVNSMYSKLYSVILSFAGSCLHSFSSNNC